MLEEVGAALALSVTAAAATVVAKLTSQVRAHEQMRRLTNLERALVTLSGLSAREAATAIAGVRQTLRVDSVQLFHHEGSTEVVAPILLQLAGIREDQRDPIVGEALIRCSALGVSEQDRLKTASNLVSSELNSYPRLMSASSLLGALSQALQALEEQDISQPDAGERLSALRRQLNSTARAA